MQNISLKALGLLVLISTGCTREKVRNPLASNTSSTSNPAYFVLKEGVDSVFKKEPKPSSQLSEWDVCALKPGKKYTYSGKAKLESDHYLVKVNHPQFDCGFRSGYVYASHVDWGGDESDDDSPVPGPIIETNYGTATLYTIEPNTMEGGPCDRCGQLLHTFKDYMKGDASYVSVAMDIPAFPYGTKLRFPEVEKRLNGGKYIEFRVVDTGDAFTGKWKSRMDICVGNSQDDIHNPPFNWMSHHEFEYHVTELGTGCRERAHPTCLQRHY